ncbi:MAG: DUF4349 domain-containing protein [Chloroflexi bacterium]|nr:MAG: DUF4349 domain-containing protein [Chloroflexota bacterium]
MSDPRSARRLAAMSILTAALVLLLAACSGGNAYAPAAASGGAAAAGQPSSAPQGAETSGPKAQFAQDERQIVKTGEITLEVDNVANALARVRAMAVELGGYVGGAQAGTLDQSATVMLRIPAPRFDDALTRLHEIGSKVLVEATHEEDVTAAVVDLEARLKNLRASEAQYRVLVARATKIEDILAVQSRLDEVQGQIEQLSAQLKQLSNQADLSTLTVTLQPRAQPIQAASSTWDPGETASNAASALLQIGQALGTIGIWLAIVGLPVVIVLTLIAFVLSRTRLLRRPVRAGPGSSDA